MAATNPKLAVFIDCENADMSLIPALFEKKPSLTKASIKRGYGDTARLSGWSEVLKQYCFQPRLTPPSTKPANASDFALTIDCLDLLYTRRFDEAWLITSDADFTQLAAHIRSFGIRVACAGKGENRPLFRKAFDEFVDYYTIGDGGPHIPTSQPDKRLLERLLSLFDNLSAHNPRGVRVSTFGNHFTERPPGFEAGSGKLRILLEETGEFAVHDGVITRVHINGHA